MFTIQIASDIFGKKVNVALPFDAKPPYALLKQVIEDVFTREMRVAAPTGAPCGQFKVVKMKLYNDATGKWSPLSTESHMSAVDDSAQVYAFQPPSSWHPENTDEIPAARAPVSESAAAASTEMRHSASASGAGAGVTTMMSTPGGQQQRIITQPVQHMQTVTQGQQVVTSSAAQQSGTTTYSYQVHAKTTGNLAGNGVVLQQALRVYDQAEEDGGRPELLVAREAHGSLADKAKMVFRQLDTNGKGYVDKVMFVEGIRRELGMNIETQTLEVLFSRGDRSQGGLLTEDEFLTFATLYPILIDCCFYRRAYREEDAAAEWSLREDATNAKRLDEQAEVAISAFRHSEEMIRALMETLSKLRGDWEAAHAGLLRAKRDVDGANSSRELAIRSEKDAAATRSALEQDRIAAEQALAKAQVTAQQAGGRKAQVGDRCQGLEAQITQLQKQLQALMAEAAKAKSAFLEASDEADRAEAAMAAARLAFERAGQGLPGALSAWQAAESAARDADAAAGRALISLREAEARLAACSNPDAKNAELEALRKRSAELSAQSSRLRMEASEFAASAKTREEAIAIARAGREAEMSKERELVQTELQVVEQRFDLAAKEVSLRREGRGMRAEHKASLRRVSTARSSSMHSMTRETTSNVVQRNVQVTKS